MLDLQNQLIQFLAERCQGLEFPQVVPAKTGEAIATIKAESGAQHLVRLFTWIDGVCLAEATPHGRELLTSLTPEQKTQAAETFDASGEFLSARKKLLDTMYELPSLEHVSKVVVDDAVINGNAEPYLIYRGMQSRAGSE